MQTVSHGLAGLRLSAALLALLLCVPATVSAHKLRVFATAHHATIEGRVYFPGDIPARRIGVVIRDAQGRELGRTTTDEQGEFQFVARSRVDHHLMAETTDGHGDGYTIRAAELSASLPGDSLAAAPTPPALSEKAGRADAAAKTDSGVAALGQQIAALETQVDLLRRQVDRSEQQTRLRDILGGIGYIVGLAGLGYYLKARRTQT